MIKIIYHFTECVFYVYHRICDIDGHLKLCVLLPCEGSLLNRGKASNVDAYTGSFE